MLRKWLVRIVLVILALLISGVVGFVVVWSNPYPASSTAEQALQSDTLVKVTDQADQIVFMPVDQPKAGLVFYPGARVAPAAYATLMHNIAQQGYAVFVIKMPINFAILGVNRANDVIAANPAIKRWAVGGHSLGGAMACTYAGGAMNAMVKGLLLYAAYPGGVDLSAKTLVVTSIYGTSDGLANPDKINAAKAYLPTTTDYVPVQGGIHAFFGDYGTQDGDGQPSISREAATDQIVTASVAFMHQIAAD